MLNGANFTIRKLMEGLLINYSAMFSKSGVLNSEGRKVLEEMIKLLMNYYPIYRRLVYKVRREPTLDNILKLARIFLSEEEINELITNSITTESLALRGGEEVSSC